MAQNAPNPSFANVGAIAQNPYLQTSMQQVQQGDQPEFKELQQFQPLSQEEWADLLHNLGSAMTQARPDIEQGLKGMMGELPDYSKEAEPLKQLIANRPTMPMPNAPARALASFGSPEAAQTYNERQNMSIEQEVKKRSDLEALQENLTTQHIQDLQRRGKFQEALSTLLLQKGFAEEAGKRRESEILGREKLRGENMVNAARERAQAMAQNFNLPAKMQLELVKAAGRFANDAASRYGQTDKVMGGYLMPDQGTYDKAMDETINKLFSEIPRIRSQFSGGGEGGNTPAPKGNKGNTSPQGETPLQRSIRLQRGGK